MLFDHHRNPKTENIPYIMISILNRFSTDFRGAQTLF